MNIFVGRQPILDIDENIYGYELLYRNSEKNNFPDVDPDKATIELIINTFLSIGEHEVAEERSLFINFTGSLLAQDVFSSFSSECIVIEILEDVAITPALITKLRSFKKNGFRIALDDFVLQHQFEENSDLFELIDYIKVDFVNTTEAERTSIEMFSAKYSNISLIAEKVETELVFSNAKSLGYKLFQGYFFAEPEIIKGIEIPPNIVLLFQVIESLNKETPNIEDVAKLIKRDISLSFKLLRFINSSGVGAPQKISSIKQAIVIIGLDEMKKWMHVLAMREIGKESNGRIQALIDYSLTRAKMCELLAQKMNNENVDEYFLAGMFSLVDVIMNQEWKDILSQIPLSDIVSRTLEGEQTHITPYIELAVAVERLNIEKIAQLAAEIGVDYEELSFYSQEANRWSQMLD